MFYILMDVNTGSYYMEPGEVAFFAYTNPANLDIHKKNIRLVALDAEDIYDFETMVYNAGFFRGFIDGKPYSLSKSNICYYDRNQNEVCYAQYLLTKDRKFLELIRKKQLVTFCKIDGESMLLPTVATPPAEKYVLAYTDRSRIPKEMWDKYAGWRSVYMTFDVKCVVNGSFVAE